MNDTTISKEISSYLEKIKDEFCDHDTSTNISRGKPITNPIKNK
jgi:hypothetical protein